MSAMPTPYDDIFLVGRPTGPFERPAPMRATKRLMEIVEDAQRTNPAAADFADWLANFMEGYGALFAQPVMDMAGNGPRCSFCWAAPWPICGHHHMSNEAGGEQ